VHPDNAVEVSLLVDEVAERERGKGREVKPVGEKAWRGRVRDETNSFQPLADHFVFWKKRERETEKGKVRPHFLFSNEKFARALPHYESHFQSRGAVDQKVIRNYLSYLEKLQQEKKQQAKLWEGFNNFFSNKFFTF
jgi:hypothetical protein